MRRAAVEVLACPQCRGPLETDTPVEEVDEGALRCPRDGATFPIRSGLPYLARLDRVDALASFAREYSRVWRRGQWIPRKMEEILRLPSCAGPRKQVWRVKARSAQALIQGMAARRPGPVLDLGCGVGWLSHLLARSGFEVYAVDIVLDEFMGLGAAARFSHVGPAFERVWGEFERIPFLRESVDVVVCNASFHYAPSPEVAAEEIARVLRPGGSFFLLNSPLHQDARSAIRAQASFRGRLQRWDAQSALVESYRHFTRPELEALLSSRIGPVREIPFDPGPAFRWGRVLKGRLLSIELASFPILEARKAAASAQTKTHR